MAVALACCTSLSGCIDAMPDMTDEQQALVAEYAADIILKHSKYYDDGLADLSELEEVEPTAEEPEPEYIEEEPEDSISEEYDLADEISEEQKELAELSNVSFAEALGFSDIDITFENFQVTDAYPDDDNAGFFVNAPQGKNMLVMQFDLNNISNETVACDIASLEPGIYVSVNGSGEKKAMSTELLLDDFSSYKGEIAAGDKVSLVVATETDGDMTVADVESIIISVELADGRFNAKLY